MLEETPIPVFLYKRLSRLLPDYIQVGEKGFLTAWGTLSQVPRLINQGAEKYQVNLPEQKTVR